MTALSRTALAELSAVSTVDPNAGWLLRRGLISWGEGESGGEAKRKLIDRIANLPAPEAYRLAFERWQRSVADRQRFQRMRLRLESRLYIGLSRDSALETGVALQHAYGMPMIPGSALKGVARAGFGSWLAGQDQALRYLFGNDHDTTDPADLESGAVVFHDAWWVPDPKTKPFVGEIVTPHHGDYYGSEGHKPATDFDSPVPAPQLAVQGSFLFVIEGDSGWATLAATVLKQALLQRGIGGKRSSGYGCFLEA